MVNRNPITGDTEIALKLTFSGTLMNSIMEVTSIGPHSLPNEIAQALGQITEGAIYESLLRGVMQVWLPNHINNYAQVGKGGVIDPSTIDVERVIEDGGFTPDDITVELVELVIQEDDVKPPVPEPEVIKELDEDSIEKLKAEALAIDPDSPRGKFARKRLQNLGAEL